MKNKLLLLVIILFIGVQINGQTTKNEKPAYLIFDSKGVLVEFSSLISDISNADICLFGELHNDPISHWLELELIKEFNLAKNKQLIVGAEMWERDNQLLIDEAFVHKFYDEAMYLESSKLWSNTKPDYLPILQYCSKNNLKFIGTNIPRRYARMVSRSGIESLNSLSELAKTYIAPLPILIDLNEYSYKTMIQDMPQGNTMKMTNPENLAKAQAVKDATMAYFIQKETIPGYLFFHFHGEFHSAYYSGIFFYLKQYNPKLKVKSISIVKQENVNVLDKENFKRADYIIVVPESMSVTY